TSASLSRPTTTDHQPYLLLWGTGRDASRGTRNTASVPARLGAERFRYCASRGVGRSRSLLAPVPRPLTPVPPGPGGDAEAAEVRDLQVYVGEPSATQAVRKTGGVDGHADVAAMQLAPGRPIEAVDTDEDAARAQHPRQLGQQLVLQRRGRHVVEHGERR